MSKLSDLVAELERLDSPEPRETADARWRVYAQVLTGNGPRLLAAAKALEMARRALRDCVGYRVIDPAAEALPAIDKVLEGE